MKNLNLLLLSFTVFIFIGCGNPNLAAPSIIQKEKNVQFIEKDYKDILLEAKIKVDEKKQLLNILRYKLQRCLIHWFDIDHTYSFVDLGNDKYSDTKINTNVWFDINNKFINIHYYISNFIKTKDAGVFKDELILGGKYGNSIYKISLPYTLSILNNGTYKITINNNKNILVKESLNSLTNKEYEPYLYKISLEKYKHYIKSSISCIE
ncbi:hypothetical protein [Arcobacter sp. YIC-310]|uniref:hypothetical protein n=1 Tax=Arcobacter sp. YIC-310 TaxID=3376632 RepID=UPI003C1A9652